MAGLQYLQAPCGCAIDCPRKIILLMGASEEHMAQHREYDAGIIHKWNCGVIMIPVPKLVVNERLLNQL